jgi:hypothetical protein
LVEWLRSAADRISALSTPRELHTRELCEAAAERLLLEIEHARSLFPALESDRRFTAWSGGNLVDLMSSACAGIAHELASVDNIGVWFDLTGNGAPDAALYARVYLAIEERSAFTLRRLADDFAAAALKPGRQRATEPTEDEVRGVLQRLGLAWDTRRPCCDLLFVERNIRPEMLRQAKRKRGWNTGEQKGANLYLVRDVVGEWLNRFVQA